MNPDTREIEQADYLDNYFGLHRYGIRFHSTNRIWPQDEWNKAIRKIEDEIKGPPMNIEAVAFELAGSKWTLLFTPGYGCGDDPDGLPGIGFDAIDGEYRQQCVGVIKRSDAKRLADMIYEFLNSKTVRDLSNPTART